MMDIVLKNLKFLRDEMGWSQEYVAERIKQTHRVYNSIENDNRKLDAETVQKLAKLYGVSIDELYDEKLKTYFTKNISLSVKEDQAAYNKKTNQIETKKVSIELDLASPEELKIFRLYLGHQYAAKLA